MVNLPHLWVTVDLPVLAQSAYALEVKHESQVDAEAVATELGLSVEDVSRSLVRLGRTDISTALPREAPEVGMSSFPT
jgi:hypothetical protein